MNFFSAIRACFDNYACIKGRSTRTEYWSFVLLMAFVYGLIHLTHGLGFTSSTVWCIAFFWTVISFLPFVSVTVRRLNDANRSIRNLFFVLLPAALFISIALIVSAKSTALMYVFLALAALLLLYFLYLMALPSRDGAYNL